MAVVDSKVITAGILLLLSIIFGIWLSRVGRPLNQFVFTFHKLLALATAIFAGIVIYSLCKNFEINAIGMILILFMILFFLALFITGVFLSFEKPLPDIVLIIHKIVSVLAIVLAIPCIYLLVKMK